MNLCHLFSKKTLVQRSPKFKMESDCRLSYKSKNLVFKCMIVFLLSVHVALGVFIDCDSVNKAKKCFCQKEDDGYEIQCPNSVRESYPISLKVKTVSDSTTEAVLKITCIPEDTNFPYDLVGGLDLGKPDQGFVIAFLDIQFCSPLSITDGFREFFKSINVNGSAVRIFKMASFNTTTVSLPQHFFNELTNLEKVDLPNNRLQTFPNISILTKLKLLNLQFNNLVSVPRDAFANNKNLSVILLDRNKLTKIEKSAFPDATKSLDISFNEISTLTYESFANLKNLKKLYLDGNPMDNLEVNTFTELPQLTELSLRYVNLKEFPAFKNLPKLEVLRMSGPHNVNQVSYNIYNEDRATTTYFPELEGVGTTGSPEAEIVLNVTVKSLPALTELQLYNLGLNDFPVLDNLPNLTKLNLARNKLQTIPDKYLSQFPNLIKLDLSRNFISVLTPLGNFNLNDLNLELNQINYLPEKFFQQLSHLKTLTLSNNKIEYFSPRVFEPLEELESLYLKKNNISFNVPPKYTIVNNPGNNQSWDMDASQFLATLTQIGLHPSPLNKCFKLKILDLSYNRIDKIYDDWKNVMPDLNNLDLSHNNLTGLTWNDFIFTSGSIQVDLRYNQITTIDMEDAMILLKPEDDAGADRGVTFRLDNNPLNCDCLAYYLKIFKLKPYNLDEEKLECKTPPELQGQKLVKVSDKKLVCPLDDSKCPKNCICWKRPFDDTIVIDCSFKNFSNTDLPDVTEESVLRQLKSFNINRWKVNLDLSGNGLSDLSTSYVSSLSSHLASVDLTKNKFTSLNFLEAVTNNNTKFAVADNPFYCSDCSGFQNVWRGYVWRLDVENMTCLDRESHQPKLLSDEDETCPVFSSALQGLVIAIGIFLVFLILFVAVYIRHGWAIRAFLYSKGLGCCLCCDGMDDDEDKTYDAFVSYSHKDEDWVLNELVNRLEERDGFKLCVHIRDWTPGDWIPEQIVRSVDQSRRTVIVLSKNFVESIWSRLEFKTAHSQALNDNTNRLILILMGEDLTDDDVKDEDLRLYMKMNTYLKWNDPWFWHKLKYALPHRKSVMEENRNILQKREQRERAIQLDKLRAKYEQNV